MFGDEACSPSIATLLVGAGVDRGGRRRRGAWASADGVCIDDKAKAVAQRLRGQRPEGVRRQQARQDAAGELPLGAAARGSEEARPADEAERPDASRTLRATSARAASRPASARSSSPRSQRPREPLRDDAEERARPRAARASPRRGLRRARERAAFRDKTRGGDQARRPQEDEPAGRRPAADAGEPGRQRHEGARARRRSTTTRSSSTTTRHYGQLDEVLYYLAYEYEQANDLKNARSRLLRPHQEDARLEVHPERVPRVRRAVLQRGAGRSVEVGPRRAGLHRGHQVPAAEQQGLRLRLVQARRTSSGTRASSTRRSTRSRRRSTSASSTPSYPGAAKLADSARRDVIPVYALKGDPGAGLQLLAQHLGRPVRRRTTRRSR